MGGFMVNGCGAADSFYKIKDLGTFQCPHCNQLRTYSLMEVKMKIRVLYIPTVSVNTKYAVACASCKNGYYVNEKQKDDILYDRVVTQMTSDGVTFYDKKALEETISGKKEDPRILEEPKEVQEEKFQPGWQETPRKKFCAKCGGRLDEQTGLCPSCDGGISSESETEQTDDPVLDDPFSAWKPEQKSKLDYQSVSQSFADRLSRKICPVCGLLYASEKTNCSVCGSELTERK